MKPCSAWQTRLPGELASTLEGIASEYEADLLVGPAGSDSEEDVAAWGLFPARQLLEAINAAIQVPAPLSGPCAHVVQSPQSLACCAATHADLAGHLACSSTQRPGR